MKYRLKDRQLQKKLDDISTGDFSKALDISTKRLIDVYQQDGLDFNLDTDRVFVEFGNDVKVCTQQKQFRACFEPGTIEARKEYNPKAWNRWPEVKPPNNVLMRIQSSAGDFMCAIWMDRDSVSEKEKEWINDTYDGMWYAAPNGKIDELYKEQWLNGTDSEILFRPWDDDEDEECQ